MTDSYSLLYGGMSHDSPQLGSQLSPHLARTGGGGSDDDNSDDDNDTFTSGGDLLGHRGSGVRVGGVGAGHARTVVLDGGSSQASKVHSALHNPKAASSGAVSSGAGFSGDGSFGGRKTSTASSTGESDKGGGLKNVSGGSGGLLGFLGFGQKKRASRGIFGLASTASNVSTDHGDDSAHGTPAAYTDDHGFYEVLFGDRNEHAQYDPERRAVDRLLESNPKTFPPLCPEVTPQLFGLITFTLGLLAACQWAPDDYIACLSPLFSLDPADNNDDDSAKETRRLLIAYLSIPLVSCCFTYFHIWLALVMMFYPIKFLGCWRIPGTNMGFPMGWQGIVPFKFKKMIAIATDLIMNRLIDMKAEFAKVKPEMVASLLEQSLFDELRELYPAIANKHKPDLWRRLPKGLQDACIARGHASAREVVTSVMLDIQGNLDVLMDVKTLVTAYFTKNPALLVEMFIQCGYQELAFIRNSGATLGFFFGLVQMVVWFFWHPQEEVVMKASTQALVVFPAFGLIVGAATNWLSLLVIFSPIEPFDVGRWLCGKEAHKNVTAVEGKTTDLRGKGKGVSNDATRGEGGCCGDGKWILHGLFLRRQREVSAVYSRLVGSQVMTMDAIVHATLFGTTVPGGPAVLQGLMRKHFVKAFDESLDSFPVLAKLTGIDLASKLLGEDEVSAMREDTVNALLRSLPTHMTSPAVLAYFDGAIGIELTLRDRMVRLPHKDFEAILHPVFQEDEWKLVAVGGGLGVVIGLLQAYFIN